MSCEELLVVRISAMEDLDALAERGTWSVT